MHTLYKQVLGYVYYACTYGRFLFGSGAPCKKGVNGYVYCAFVMMRIIYVYILAFFMRRFAYVAYAYAARNILNVCVRTY